jgi:hypothetical protein
MNKELILLTRKYKKHSECIPDEEYGTYRYNE